MSESAMETSLINLSQNAFKTVILINGGAAVALLAFLGNIWAKDPAVNVVILLAESISLFSIGVLTGALGSGMIYACNFLYAINIKYGEDISLPYFSNWHRILRVLWPRCLFCAHCIFNWFYKVEIKRYKT